MLAEHTLPDDEIEGRSETKVWVTASDPLFVRADLMVRNQNHLGAVVDGVMLDLGLISDDLMAAMALTHQVHVRAGHFNGSQIERCVPLVHQETVH